MTDQKDKEFLEYIIKSLVDNQDAVKVERSVDEMGVLLSLKVDPSDMGKIIGKGGATAKAIRTLLKAAGVKNRARINLMIEEPAGSVRSEMRRMPQSVDDVVEDLKL